MYCFPVSKQSPADINHEESLNTLKYANRARNIKNKVRFATHRLLSHSLPLLFETHSP